MNTTIIINICIIFSVVMLTFTLYALILTGMRKANKANKEKKIDDTSLMIVSLLIVAIILQIVDVCLVTTGITIGEVVNTWISELSY